MDLDLHPVSRHVERVFNAFLFIDGEFLGNNVDDFFFRRVAGFGGVHHPFDIVFVDGLAFDADDSVEVHPLDVLPRNAHVNFADGIAGLPLALHDCLVNHVGGVVDVHDHAFVETLGLDLPETLDFNCFFCLPQMPEPP